MEVNTSGNIDTTKSIKIDEVTASLFQIFSQYRYLSTKQLEEFIEILKQDWNVGTDSSSSPTFELKAIFKIMNKRLRQFSFEVKTVALRKGNQSSSGKRNSSSNDSSSDEWEYFHGLVNTEEDFISKEYGNNYSPIELKFLHLLVVRLVMLHSLSTADILELRRLDSQSFSKINNTELYALLNRLEQDLWIQRNDRGHYIIAPRVFLELQSYLETTISEGQILGLEEFTEVERMNAVKELPSIILY